MRELEPPFHIQELAKAPLVGEAARLLALVPTGVDVGEMQLEMLAGSLADIADAHGATPDDMQQALAFSEPSLVPIDGTQQWKHAIDSRRVAELRPEVAAAAQRANWRQIGKLCSLALNVRHDDFIISPTLEGYIHAAEFTPYVAAEPHRHPDILVAIKAANFSLPDILITVIEEFPVDDDEELIVEKSERYQFTPMSFRRLMYKCLSVRRRYTVLDKGEIMPGDDCEIDRRAKWEIKALRRWWNMDEMSVGDYETLRGMLGQFSIATARLGEPDEAR